MPYPNLSLKETREYDKLLDRYFYKGLESEEEYKRLGELSNKTNN